jgi:hypothetical protein
LDWRSCVHERGSNWTREAEVLCSRMLRHVIFMFHRSMLPPSSGPSYPSLSYPEDRGGLIFPNVDTLPSDYTVAATKLTEAIVQLVVFGRRLGRLSILPTRKYQPE